MLDKALEPCKFIVEFGARLGIAVGKIDRRDNQALGFCFQVSRLPIVGVPWKSTPNFSGFLALSQNRDTVIRPLPVPDRAITRSFERRRREFGVVRFDLLQAYNVGSRLRKPLQQTRQAAVDAIDVVRSDLQCPGIPRTT